MLHSNSRGCALFQLTLPRAVALFKTQALGKFQEELPVPRGARHSDRHPRPNKKLLKSTPTPEFRRVMNFETRYSSNQIFKHGLWTVASREVKDIKLQVANLQPESD